MLGVPHLQPAPHLIRCSSIIGDKNKCIWRQKQDLTLFDCSSYAALCSFVLRELEVVVSAIAWKVPANQSGCDGIA